MKVRNAKPMSYSSKATSKDAEANTILSWGEKKHFNAYIYPASGQAQAEQYGNELGYILNLLTNDLVLTEGDGVYVYDETEPDYVVISIKRYTDHHLVEVKKR